MDVDFGELYVPPQSERSAPGSKSRQAKRRFLFFKAFELVTTRQSKLEDNPHGKGKHWFILMPRSERRKLARAYAAGEWRRESPVWRGMRQVADA